MFGLGGGEIVVVLILALIFLGPKRLPEIATRLGKFVRQVQRAVDDIKDDLKND
jgi:Tat protein translocase TatB subunit